MDDSVVELLCFSDDELHAMAPILMAAALSDGAWDGAETQGIRDLLVSLGPYDRLPPELLEALIGYDENDFDLDAALARLDVSTTVRKRALLALVGAVIASDGRIVRRERDFMGRVAEAIGFPDDELRALTDDLRTLMAERDEPEAE